MQVDTTRYFLSFQGNTASVHVKDQGQWTEFSQQLPVNKAVDLVRRLINGDQFEAGRFDQTLAFTPEIHRTVAHAMRATRHAGWEFPAAAYAS